VPVAAADRAVRRTRSVVTCAFMVDLRRLPERTPFDFLLLHLSRGS
jgi:hypothetical protein